MAIKKCYLFRYGFRASDTTIQDTYYVETDGIWIPGSDAQESGYYVIRHPEGTPTDVGVEAPTYDILPKINDTHPNNRFFRVLPGGITAERDVDNSNVWIVTVTYTQTNQIFDEVTDFSITNRVYTRVSQGAYQSRDPDNIPITKEVPEVPYVNSTLVEAYDPADLQEEYYHTVIQFTLKQTLEFDYVETLKYIGSVNKNEMAILGFELQPYQGLMRSVIPNFRVDEDGNGRWYTFYEIEIAEDGRTHEIVLQDQGYMANFGTQANPKIREIYTSDIDDTITKGDEKDKPVTKPQLLDGAGKILDDTSNPFYISFLSKRALNWDTELELPTEKYEVDTEETDIEL